MQNFPTVAYCFSFFCPESTSMNPDVVMPDDIVSMNERSNSQGLVFFAIVIDKYFN